MNFEKLINKTNEAINNNKKDDFIKIDIEGRELNY